MTTARQAVTDSLHHLGAPIPGLEPNRRRRRTVILGGGVVFWLILGWLYVMWVFVVAAYVGAILAVRAILVLGALCWWGADSTGGVIGRRFHHRDVKHLPPPPDHLVA